MMISLGAYPDDPYYDPGRPSWLPYWIDTPTESAMKWGLYPNVTTTREPEPLPKPPTPPVPGSHGPGAVESVVSESARRQREQTQEYMQRVAQEEENRQKQRSQNATIRTVLLAAGAALAVWVVLRR